MTVEPTYSASYPLPSLQRLHLFCFSSKVTKSVGVIAPNPYVTALFRSVCVRRACARAEQGGDEDGWWAGGGGAWRSWSVKACDFISHIAPRPVIFPTADRRWKPLLCRGKESVASLVWSPHRLKSQLSGRRTASPPGLSSSILFWPPPKKKFFTPILFF